MASSYVDVVKFVETEIKAKWTHTEYVFDNTPSPKNIDEWIKVEVQSGAGINVLISGVASVGPKTRSRHVGLIFGTIHTPINTGTQRNNELAQLFADLFAKKRVSSDIVTFASDVRRIGEDAPWFTQICEISFYRDHVPD